MNRKTIFSISILSLFCFQFLVYAQSLTVHLSNYKSGKVIIYSLSGEKTARIDSVASNEDGKIFYQLDSQKYHTGFYRLSFDKNKWIDFVNDGEDVSISTNANNVLDSLQVVSSESNKLYYSFIKLNKAYKTKTELLQLILARYPKEDNYYKTTQDRLTQIQNEYIEFVNVTSQANPNSFIAKYIRSAQLPVVDISIPFEKQLAYLKAHALDNIDFNNSLLINSDLFSNKTIEYLTYYRNPQLPLELLEKEFMVAVDSILSKAKVNQLVYQHIVEYLIDGFKKFGFDKVLDYIVENYVIKDDLCLDVKTEGLIKRRIDQAKFFKIGSIVPNIIISDLSGKQIELKNITAEKTLIVFYASWCPHCKELLPKLNELYKNQKVKKFEVLAVSLDSKKDDWQNFINTNCPSLINVSDLKGWEGKAATDFFIYATPTMFLIDNEKKIIGKPIIIEEVKVLLKF
ncbi:MAG: TlpA family protein disulfide reductase [Ignavibacteriales bacterium]|nr:TlpA family protein disulfide reductase [Ignavibacteriales bacterium]